MKLTKFTNLTLKPLKIILYRSYDDYTAQTGTVMIIDGSDSLEVKGNIDYVVDIKRAEDLRVDTYYE